MNCPHCATTTTRKRAKQTKLGYRTFFCLRCRCTFPRAIRETMGSHVQHRMSKYLNNRLEQDHRGIKQRYYPMRGFGTIKAAARFYRAFDELRNDLRSRRTMGEVNSLREQRQAFLQRLVALQTAIQAAS